MLYTKFLSPLFVLLILVIPHVAWTQSDMMMDDGMMMSGWMMLLCILFGVLLFLALVLSILALLKYLFRK